MRERGRRIGPARSMSPASTRSRSASARSASAVDTPKTLTGGGLARARARARASRVLGHDGGELGPGPQPQLAEDPRQVALDRLLAEEQRRGDVAICLPGGDLLGHLALAC